MNVTIIGTGRMGRAIATRFISGGHQVALLGHTPEKAEVLANELRQTAINPNNVTVMSGDNLEGEVVVLAVPYSATSEIAQKYGDNLAGKVIVDITNPVNFETMTPLLENTSGAEEIAKETPDSARVVKAFNTAFASNVFQGEKDGTPLDIFIAGDDEQAKATVAQLIEDGGMRPIDAGQLVQARQLEALGLLHMVLQNTRKTGYMSAIKIFD